MKKNNPNKDVHSDFNTLKQLILSSLHEENFVVEKYSNLKTLPREIVNLKLLCSLSIRNCPNLEELPVELSELSMLKSLSIVGSSQKKLPKNLDLLVNLRKLALKASSFGKKTDWAALNSLQKLESFELSGSLKSLKSELAAEIFSIKNIQFLYLDNNNLHKLPYRISELKNLILLDLSRNTFVDFPDVLVFLPKLETLIIDAAVINSVPFEIFEMPALKELKISGRDSAKYPLVSHFEKFFNLSKKNKFDKNFIYSVLDTLKYPELMSELEINELIPLLNCGLEPIVSAALELLDKDLSEAYIVPAEGSVLYIGSKTFESKAVLKSKLKVLGISISTKISKEISHVLLSPGLKTTDFSELPDSRFITEKMLMDLFDDESNLLSEKNIDFKDSLEKIRMLLNSGDEDNNLLGLQLLGNSMLPDTLLTDLLFLYKKTSNTNIRKITLGLVQKSGHLSLALNLKKRIALLNISETTLTKNLLFYCSFNLINRFRLLNLVYNLSGNGRNFALLHLNSLEKLHFFTKLIENGQLDLSCLEIQKLPDDFYIFSEQVYSLVLNNNNFDSFPIAALLKLKNLKKLNFAENYSVWHYPDNISQLKNLELFIVPENFELRATAKLIVELEKMHVELKIGGS
jgi:hypothetical protein